MQTKRRSLIYALILTLSFGFVSCMDIVFEFAYNRLDTMIVDRVDDMFGLTDSQEDFVSAQAADFLEWHRKNELPKYVSFLQRIKSETKGELTEAKVKSLRASLENIIRRSGNKLTPATAQFLSTTDDAQIPTLKAWFNEFNVKYNKRLAKPEHLKAQDRFNRSVDFLEDFFGDFSQKDKDVYLELIDEMPNMDKAFHTVRLQRQKQLVTYIRSDAEKDKYAAWLAKMFKGSRHVATGKLRQEFDDWYDRVPGFVSKFWNTRSAAQKAYFHKQLDVWIGRFRSAYSG